MGGKRAPELAVEQLRAVFAQLWHLHFSAFVFGDDDFQLLSPEETQQINDEMELGRAYVELQINTKFDFWARLPWHLVALAHVDEQEARAAAV